jgi:hypothetical protein
MIHSIHQNEQKEDERIKIMSQVNYFVTKKEIKVKVEKFKSHIFFDLKKSYNFL